MVARGFQSTYKTMHIQSWLINALFVVIQRDTYIINDVRKSSRYLSTLHRTLDFRDLRLSRKLARGTSRVLCEHRNSQRLFK